MYKSNNNMNELQNYFNSYSSQPKIVYRPMTPQYQRKNNNILTYNYKNNNNNNIIPNYLINPNTNNITNYAPIKTTRQIIYKPNPQILPTKNYKAESPIRTNNHFNYIITPPRCQRKQVIIQNPLKINPPIVQYKHNTGIIKPKPVIYTYNNNKNYITTQQPQKAIYNTISSPNPNQKKIIKYIRYVPKIPVNLNNNNNIYQPKNIVNYPNNVIPYSNKINNNISPIKNNPSIINSNHLQKIQRINQLNQTNPYNIYSTNSIVSSLSNNNINNLNKSITSISSGSSYTPKKYDRNGNPVYSVSLNSTPNKLKRYQDIQYSRRTSPDNLRRSLSSDALSAPLQRGRNRLDNYNMSPISTRNQSPILSPVLKNNNNQINYNLDNTRSNNYNNVLKPNVIYNNRKNNNISYHTLPKSTVPKLDQMNNSVILQNLNLNESEKIIINKYTSSDLTDPSNFYPSNFNLFYLTSPEFFYIPKNEIVTQRQVRYPVSQMTYKGGFNAYNQRHGLGTLKSLNDTKIGSWRNNQFTGWGRVIRNNGQVFEGKFLNNNLSGKGVYSFGDVLFFGDFENGIRQGKGVLLTKSMKYKGDFNKGKIDGYGKILFINDKEGKSEYEGFFKENNIEGKGVMKWINGNMYEGEMKNGKMNGRGRFTPYNSIPNEGIFRDNVKVGTP